MELSFFRNVRRWLSIIHLSNNESSVNCRALLYFGHLPMEGAGSAIIVLRHLRRLKAEGWNIRIIGDWGQDESICREEGWEVCYLPHRRPWWPPYMSRHDLSARVRHWLWAGESGRLHGVSKPDAVLTYLSAFSDTLSQVAAAYSTRFRVPLTTLIHDDCRAFMRDGGSAASRWMRYRWIMSASAQNWFVSPELADAYGFQDVRQSSVLAPLCEGWATQPPEEPPKGAPLLVYAGNVRDPQVPVLERMSHELDQMDASLLVLADSTPALASALERSPLSWQAPFPTNREALDWLQLHATALVVAYADRSADQPWVKSSFPSKFVEYLHLGIPVLLVVPDDSAVACWARRHGWEDCITPVDRIGLRGFMDSIADSEVWRAKGRRSLEMGRKHFDPINIHGRFSSALAPASLVGRAGES